MLKNILELMDIVHIVELLCIERGRDMSPLWLSLWVASIALIIVIVSGLAACYWMNRCKWSGMAIIDLLPCRLYCHQLLLALLFSWCLRQAMPLAHGLRRMG